MSNGLPPPPIKAASGDFLWIDWYNKLNNLLNTGGVVAWTNINFAGSNLSDIVNRNHNNLTGIQGGTTGEEYHLTLAQYTSLGVGAHNSLSSIQGGNSTERYHFTNAEHTALAGFVAGPVLLSTFSSTVDPTTTDITASKFAIYKNTTSGLLKLWANDGGTMKSVTLT
jgi:hypothetical protein